MLRKSLIVLFVGMIIVLSVLALTAAQSATILASGPPLIDPFGITISPDGTTLFITDYSANAVFRLPATGGTPTVIASGPPFVNTRGITISPDGTTLFVAGYEAHEIISLPATGGTPTILASGSPFVGPIGIAISPDGSTLFIADSNDVTGAVFSLPVIGGSPTLLAAGAPLGGFGGPHSLIVSPDGSTLFISAGFNGLFSLPVTGGTPSLIAPLVPPIDFYGALALSADGSTLFVHNGGGGLPPRFNPGPSAIYSLPVSGGSLTLVFSGSPLVAAGEVSHSHDGTALFVADTGFSDRYLFGPVGEPGRVFAIITVEEAPPMPVRIDIKPGSDPNSINPKSKGKIPVAILSTASFNAPERVDKASLTFGRTGEEASLAFCNQSPEDVNGDNLLDQVCHFHTQRMDFRSGDTVGVLRGRTLDGTFFEGQDSVRIVH